MSFRFEKLEIWKLAREFTVEIYKLTRGFPKDELFSLSAQMRRAAISVALNITEGSDRKSDIEFKRFLRMSLASLEEVITGLYIAFDQGFINKKDFNSLYQQGNRLASKINALINTLKQL